MSKSQIAIVKLIVFVANHMKLFQTEQGAVVHYEYFAKLQNNLWFAED